MTFGELRFQLTRLMPGADPDVIDQAINNRLESIEKHIAWKALEANGVFVTPAAVSGGTAAVTNGSASVTLTGASWSSALTGRRFRVLARNETYSFTYVDATHGTLDRAYEGDSDAAASYSIFQVVYPLPADFKNPMFASNERIGQEIVYESEKSLFESSPALNTSGEPWFWTETARDTDGTRQAILYPAPQFAASYPFKYFASLPRYAAGDTSVSLPSWISIRGLMAGVRADVEKDAGEESVFQYELSQMRAEDARARGPRQLKMAAQYTRHRMERVLRNYRRHLP
jgi:hypothetical protein